MYPYKPYPTDWDALIASGESTNDRLRRRDFTGHRPGDAGRDFARFLATPHGDQLPVWHVRDPGTGDLLYWDTHGPSAAEYARQTGPSRLVLERRGTKGDWRRTGMVLDDGGALTYAAPPSGVPASPWGAP